MAGVCQVGQTPPDLTVVSRLSSARSFRARRLPVVWIPTILIAQRLTKAAKQSEFWKAAFRGCPTWMRIGVYVLGGYAVLNFILFIATARQYPKNEVPDVVNYRGFSGHWMLFYYVASATLYSAIRLGGVSQPRCRNGHEVSPFANYCDVCGGETRSSVP
jgi:hypothetical protein